jgi:hypothetical protein
LVIGTRKRMGRRVAQPGQSRKKTFHPHFVPFGDCGHSSIATHVSSLGSTLLALSHPEHHESAHRNTNRPHTIRKIHIPSYNMMPATFPSSQLPRPDNNRSSEAVDSHEHLGQSRTLSVDTIRGRSTVRFHSNQNTSESMMHLDNVSTLSVKWPSTPSSTSISAHPTTTTLRRPSIILITSRPPQITSSPYKSSPIDRHLSTAGTVVSHRFDKLFDPTADDGPDSPSDLDKNELCIISKSRHACG